MRKLLRRLAQRIPASSPAARIIVAALYGLVDLYGPFGGSAAIFHVYLTSLQIKRRQRASKEKSRMYQQGM